MGPFTPMEAELREATVHTVALTWRAGTGSFSQEFPGWSLSAWDTKPRAEARLQRALYEMPNDLNYIW